MRALIDHRDGELIHRALPDIRARCRDASLELLPAPSPRDAVLALTGSPESVAKAAGLVRRGCPQDSLTSQCVRVIQNEPLDGASAPDARAMVLRFLIHHRAIGAIIGPGGQTVKDIEAQSNSCVSARLAQYADPAVS